MDVLFRLSKKGDISIDNIEEYFTEEIFSEDGSYFYSSNKMNELNEGDTVYFSHEGYLYYLAKYAGDYQENTERNETYKHGYKLYDIEEIVTKEKVDSGLFKGQAVFFYLNDKQKKEIQRILNSNTSSDAGEFSNTKSYPEGAKKTVNVNAYERNPIARKKCIDEYDYKCQVCSFDFKEKYGKIGENFIQVHHIVPLSKMGRGYNVDPVKDLIPVCPNCHSMIHRNTKENPYSIEEMKAIIEEAKSKS